MAALFRTHKKIRISFESCHDGSIEPTERVMKASCKYIFAYGKLVTVIYKTLYISWIHNKRNKNNHYSHMNYSNYLSLDLGSNRVCYDRMWRFPLTFSWKLHEEFVVRVGEEGNTYIEFPRENEMTENVKRDRLPSQSWYSAVANHVYLINRNSYGLHTSSDFILSNIANGEKRFLYTTNGPFARKVTSNNFLNYGKRTIHATIVFTFAESFFSS